MHDEYVYDMSKRSHLFIVHMKCLTKYDQVVNLISIHFVDWVRKIKNINLRTQLKNQTKWIKLKCIKNLKV
jgi:hypothetical protein